MNLKEIYEFLVTNITNTLAENNPQISLNKNTKSIVHAMATSLAPLFLSNQEYLEIAVKQCNPFTADSISNNPQIGQLEVWGLWRLQRYPEIAKRGIYEIEITGTGEVEAEIILKDKNSKYSYQILSKSTISGKTIVSIIAKDEGKESELFEQDEVFFIQNLAGIDNLATVKKIKQAPTNAEDIEDYRRKIINTLRILPRGSARGDYYLYATEIAGVLSAYPYSGDYLGTAKVYIKADASSQIDTIGTPPPTLIEEVKKQSILNGSLTAQSINFLAIIPRTYNISVSGTSDAVLKKQVEDIIKEYFKGKEPFIAGIDDVQLKNKERISKSELLGQILVAISPKIIDDIVIDVTNKQEFNTKTTVDISGNFANIFGLGATNEQYLNLIVNSVNHEIKITSAQTALDLIAYARILHINCIQYGVSVISDNNKLIFTLLDKSISSTLSFAVKTSSTGVDLYGTTQLDLANTVAKNLGDVIELKDISTDVLPEGNIPNPVIKFV